MGIRVGPSRRATWLVVVVMGLVLAMGVATVALAANTASFSKRTPASGSSITETRPLISVRVYDPYGVANSRNVTYSMTIDGNRLSSGPILTYVPGYGIKQFTLAHRPPQPMAAGRHTVAVMIKDTRGLVSNYAWSFTVGAPDTTPPVTTASGTLPAYPGPFTITLSTEAGAKTYWRLDGGPVNQGTIAMGTVLRGAHTFSYWSVDAAGNAETPKTITVTAASSHYTPAVSCSASGCHTTDIATIHIAKGCAMCHANGVTPSRDCVACHGANPHTAHPAILSVGVGDQSCTQANCHAAGINVHDNCQTCHANPAFADEIAAGGASCETCHGTTAMKHPTMAASHTVAGACFTSTCHGTDVAAMHTSDFRGTGALPPGCNACHGEGIVPSRNCQTCHPDLVTPHDAAAAHAAWQAGLPATGSAVCTTCHGSNIMAVLPADNEVTHRAEHVGCSCHAYNEVRGTTECASCHSPHGFSQSVAPWDPTGTWAPAGGHNTSLYDVKGGTEHFGEHGVIVKSSTGATIEQHWPRPTAAVFWSQSSRVGTDSVAVAMANRGGDPAALAAAVRTDVGWGSVITCYDCHTELEGLVGPQGANEANFGLDPNFPDDWTQASLTTWDPTGMRSVATTLGTGNPYYEMRWVGIDNNGVARDTTTPNGSYFFGDLPGRYICQKCHKLTNLKQGYPAQDRSGRSKPDMGVSNSAHMEHHPDQRFGQGNCVSCHVAIPHGWKRPRLLVYESDPAPFKASQPTTTTPVFVNGVQVGFGNWTYVSSASGTSTHLEGIYAGPDLAPADIGIVPGFAKELLSHVRRPGEGQYVGWDMVAQYVEWVGPGTETGEAEGQPNCNACSATGSTHTPTSEGIPPGEPTWK